MIDSYTKEKWNSIKIVQDLVEFMEDPKCDVMGMSNELVDLDKSSFWTAANVEFDIDIQQIINIKPNIRHDEISETTMVPSELEYHKKNNYTNGYDRIRPNNEIKKIVKALGFGDNSSVWVNNQPPGAIMGRHVDFIGCFTYENIEKDKALEEMLYDKEKRQPVGLKTIWRCFVALTDWQPGQIVNFEPGFWTEWKKGDVVFFDWKNTPHSTANCGSKNRPFLKITGVLDDDSFVEEARTNGTVKQFKA
jgi:hypothetical protein